MHVRNLSGRRVQHLHWSLALRERGHLRPFLTKKHRAMEKATIARYPPADTVFFSGCLFRISAGALGWPELRMGQPQGLV
jgi:hypothetical protein